MGFSVQLGKKVLIACGRHCALCHKYCGIKVKLHHIVDSSKGAPTNMRISPLSASIVMLKCVHMTTNILKELSTPLQNFAAIGTTVHEDQGLSGAGKSTRLLGIGHGSKQALFLCWFRIEAL